MKGPVTVLMRGVPPRFGRDLRLNLVAGILALVVALGIGRFAYTPILPAMQERFDLSNAVAGTLASSNYLGYLLGALLAAFVPAGRARDTLLRASLLVAAVSTVLMSLAASYPLWLILRFTAGLASAGVLVLGSAVMLQELSRRGQLRLSGIFYSGPGIGIALSGFLILPLNTLLAGEPAMWRTDWLLLGAVALVLAVPCMAWLPTSEAAEEIPGNAGSVTSGVEPETESSMPTGVKLAIVLLCLAYFLAGAGYIVTGTFLPTIVEYIPGLRGLGAGAWTLVGLAAAPSTVLWTRMAWRVGSVAALIAAYVGQATGILLPAISDTKWAAACSALLFGGTFVGIAALTLTYAREVIGGPRSGLAIGLLTAAYGVGQVLGPLVAVALAGEAGGFGPALVLASAAVALGALLLPVAGFSAARRDRRAEPVNRRERGAPTKGTEQFFDELEQKFDLVRLRRLRAGLREKDARLTHKEELLKANLINVVGPRRWRRIPSTKAQLFWIGARRQALADRQRWLLSLEGEIEFALRLRSIHRSKWDRESRDV